jgi:phosphate acyltransferase
LNNPLRIAIDVMGGDFAPSNELEGAILASKNSYSVPIEFVLVGKESEIKSRLSQLRPPDSFLHSIVHTDEVVTMDDEPTVAYRTKKNSSLITALELHRKGEVSAVISAGNTGAVMSCATLVLGRIKGVSRPTIGTFMPTTDFVPTFLTDAGANVDCKPRFLYEFGLMGSIYVRNVLGIESPTVSLLNVGEEKSKGNAVALEAYEMLSASKAINFIGNTEGRDIFEGKSDVIVCDGFTGNIVLKFAESFLTTLRKKVKQYSERGLKEKLTAGLMRNPLRSMLKDFNYEEYGGVPLLGVNGVVIIGHGKSTPYAIQNMLNRGIEVAQNNINSLIQNALKEDNV